MLNEEKKELRMTVKEIPKEELTKSMASLWVKYATWVSYTTFCRYLIVFRESELKEARER